MNGIAYISYKKHIIFIIKFSEFSKFKITFAVRVLLDARC